LGYTQQYEPNRIINISSVLYRKQQSSYRRIRVKKIFNFRTIESNRGNIAKFCITKVILTPGKNHIKAHTCFNRLDLPEFRYKKDLQEALNFVARNEIFGFGID